MNISWYNILWWRLRTQIKLWAALISRRECLVYVSFRKPVKFKNGYSAITLCPLKKEVEVWIDYISKDVWQLPLEGTKDFGNPKLKKMSKKEFKNVFKIASLQRYL